MSEPNPDSKKMIMSDNVTPVAHPLIVLREESDDWAILFNPDTGEGFAIDPVAVFIWKRLDGRHMVADIASELKTRFDRVPADVEAHCREFIAELATRGLLSPGHPVRPIGGEAHRG